MKKIFRKYRKAKGFTLVELLIVIIIIGILAGMMMLATGSATDKAEATKIVSNMRNIKAAAVMYYADENKWPTATTDYPSVDSYMDTALLTTASADQKGKYTIAEGSTSSDVKVQFVLNTGNDGISKKLAQMAEGSNFTYSGTTATMPISR